MNIKILRDEMIRSWEREFPSEYFHLCLDKGRIYGERFWSNRRDSIVEELRIATKYEITINDIYVKLNKLLGSEK